MWVLLLLFIAAVTSAATTPALTPGGVSGYQDPHCGGRQVIVQLFGWKWTDVAAECEAFLGPHHFCAAQVSPPNEHIQIDKPPAPWWQRYQPVSYKLVSRSGTEAAFTDMVTRCKAAGVRIYVDAVFNNMAEIGRYGKGSAGSDYDSDFKEFDAVPYTGEDFHDHQTCHSADTFVDNYNDPDEVRNCSYIGWTDLDQSSNNVRDKVSEYLNRLIQLGVAGFRIALAKFMWPQDLNAIQTILKDLPEGGRPFIYHHVEDYGTDVVKTSEYTGLGYVTEFRYGRALADAMTQGLDKLQDFPGKGKGVTPSDHALVFVDNHETQRRQQVGMTELSFRQPRLYSMATAYMLAHDYGFVRLMSSYRFTQADSGPPGDAAAQTTESVTIQADGFCGGDWVCEHRWPRIAPMVYFRNNVTGRDVNNRVDQHDFVAFSRGDAGFFAMTSNKTYAGDVKTGLAPGRYCDVISQCQRIVTVNEHGSARLDMHENVNPVVAVLSGWPAPPISTANLASMSTDYLSQPLLSSEQTFTAFSGATVGGVDSSTVDLGHASASSSSFGGLLSSAANLGASVGVTEGGMVMSSSSQGDGGSAAQISPSQSLPPPFQGSVSVSGGDILYGVTEGVMVTSASSYGDGGSAAQISPSQSLPSSLQGASSASRGDVMSGNSDVWNSGFSHVVATSFAPSFSSAASPGSSSWDHSTGSPLSLYESSQAFSASPSSSSLSGRESGVINTTPASVASSSQASAFSPQLSEMVSVSPSSATYMASESMYVSPSSIAYMASEFISVSPSASAYTASESLSVTSAMSSFSPQSSAYVSISPSATSQTTATALPATTTTMPRPVTEAPYKRTVILLHYRTNPGEYVFFRGGIDDDNDGHCNKNDVALDPCSIPIRDRYKGDSSHLNEYNTWRQGDNFLDWYGAEPGQKRFHTHEAKGSPGIWTTNREGVNGYSRFNRYGDHYWLLDVDMDCSKMDDGYFELRAFSTVNRWERGVHRPACTGSGSYPPPADHTASNHAARCGYVNVFKDGGPCEINSFDMYQNIDFPIIG